jgi:hypothetical protein
VTAPRRETSERRQKHRFSLVSREIDLNRKTASAKKNIAAVAKKHSQIVSAEILADVFGLTETRIHQLVAKEKMPKESRGRFDLMICIRFYIKYLQTRIEKRSVEVGGEITALSDQRVRGLKAGAELKEMEVSLRRGEVVRVDDVRAMLGEMILMTKARLLAIPPRLAVEVMGEESRVMVQAKIEKAIKDALTQLADDGSAYHFVSKRRT